MLTRLSVVCALRIVATNSSSGLVKSSSVCASGYSSASSRLILRALRTSAVRDTDVGGTCLAYAAARARRAIHVTAGWQLRLVRFHDFRPACVLRFCYGDARWSLHLWPGRGPDHDADLSRRARRPGWP